MESTTQAIERMERMMQKLTAEKSKRGSLAGKSKRGSSSSASGESTYSDAGSEWRNDFADREDGQSQDSDDGKEWRSEIADQVNNHSQEFENSKATCKKDEPKLSLSIFEGSSDPISSLGRANQYFEINKIEGVYEFPPIFYTYDKIEQEYESPPIFDNYNDVEIKEEEYESSPKFDNYVEIEDTKKSDLNFPYISILELHEGTSVNVYSNEDKLTIVGSIDDNTKIGKRISVCLIPLLIDRMESGFWCYEPLLNDFDVPISNCDGGPERFAMLESFLAMHKFSQHVAILVKVYGWDLVSSFRALFVDVLYFDGIYCDVVSLDTACICGNLRTPWKNQEWLGGGSGDGNATWENLAVLDFILED